VSAEWVKVGETDIMIVYINATTIRKDRNLRGIWEQDYKQRRNDGLMSRRVLDEFHCREEQVGILSLFNHSEPMARRPAPQLGDDSYISTNVPRSTPAELIYNIVCAC
jgi:hypothetical protein